MFQHIGRNLRTALDRHDVATESASSAPSDPVTEDGEIEFVAYALDCVLSGRLRMDDVRLSDMLNGQTEYVLHDVSVERLDGGEPMTVDEITVARDEVYMVHASGPRGDVSRRHRTAPQHVALNMGPYQVRGFFHALPGTDPATSIRRRKAMVPLTNARIEYEIATDHCEVRVDALIVNRELMDWLREVEPDRMEFPLAPQILVTQRK